MKKVEAIEPLTDRQIYMKATIREEAPKVLTAHLYTVAKRPVDRKYSIYPNRLLK